MLKPYCKNDLSTLYNGDCLDVMSALAAQNEKVNLVITSPPYNTSNTSGTMEDHQIRYDIYIDTMTNKEYIQWTNKIFRLYDSILKKDGAILYNMSYGSNNTELMFLIMADIITNTNFTVADVIVWKKKSAIPNNASPNKLTRIIEYVFVFCRKSEFNTFKMNKKLLSINQNNQSIYENIYNLIIANNNDQYTELNKATFSKDFVHALLEIYYVDGRVLDNFNGTGTTLAACQERNISGIGIELSEGQCEYTKSRISLTQVKFNL